MRRSGQRMIKGTNNAEKGKSSRRLFRGRSNERVREKRHDRGVGRVTRSDGGVCRDGKSDIGV